LADVDVPKINPRAAEPPYRQIAAWLRSRIEAGEFEPGIDPLPSEKDLQDTFEISRDTARRAVAVLRDEGLVVTVPQRGTYVVVRGSSAESPRDTHPAPPPSTNTDRLVCRSERVSRRSPQVAAVAR
jgi:DNA-binding GntR family transcriptional regulator